jgi:hypothetical protein
MECLGLDGESQIFQPARQQMYDGVVALIEGR